MVWSIALLAVLIGLDQALKYWTVTHLALGESAQLIPGVLQLTRLHNYGAAWSSLSGKTAVLLVITAALMIAEDNTSLAEYTGDSFRDLTRIARLNDKMWAELFLWNKENLINQIDQFDMALQTIKKAMEDDDREKLERLFQLSTKRRALFDKKQ